MYRVIRGQEDLRTRSNREAQVSNEQLAGAGEAEENDPTGRAIGPNMTHLLRAILAIWLLRIAVFRTSAYIDPGSGSMLLGGAAGVAIVVKIFWYRIANVLGIRRGYGENVQDEDTS